MMWDTDLSLPLSENRHRSSKRKEKKKLTKNKQGHHKQRTGGWASNENALWVSSIIKWEFSLEWKGSSSLNFQNSFHTQDNTHKQKGSLKRLKQYVIHAHIKHFIRVVLIKRRIIEKEGSEQLKQLNITQIKEGHPRLTNFKSQTFMAQPPKRRGPFDSFNLLCFFPLIPELQGKNVCLYSAE